MAAFDLGPDWVQVANAADDPVTVQAVSETGMEVVFSELEPDEFAVGLFVGPYLAVTRMHGTGNIWVRAWRRPNDNRDPGRAIVAT